MNATYAKPCRFGRKSEAFQGEQRGLFDEDIGADAADIEQQLATLLPEPTKPKPQVAKRQSLPPELPREEVRLAPASNNCPDSGHTLRFIRDEISERLEYVPARFIVHRYIRPQFSCTHCEAVVSEPVADWKRVCPVPVCWPRRCAPKSTSCYLTLKIASANYPAGLLHYFNRATRVHRSVTKNRLKSSRCCT